jgi:RING-H2 zinc finger protein RHA1
VWCTSFSLTFRWTGTTPSFHLAFCMRRDRAPYDTYRLLHTPLGRFIHMLRSPGRELSSPRCISPFTFAAPRRAGENEPRRASIVLSSLYIRTYGPRALKPTKLARACTRASQLPVTVMTFPLVCYCDAVAALFKFLHAVALAFVLILCFLGLYEFPYTPEDMAPLINGRERAPRGDAPKPEAVKQRLPPVEYLELATSLAARGSPPEDATCRVCLERLEARDEVRRLGNCAHAFHTACIDHWIDTGEVTCPLCRAQLLPRRRLGMFGWARFG